ncbi:leucine-rich repeat domain-containing protein, partial [Tannerella forsythia]
MYCYKNPLTALDVNGCTQLTSLQCYENQLTTLNVSGCTQLKQLHCFENQLTALDVSGCTQLMWLSCFENLLTALNVSRCTQLKQLDCFRNNFSTAALNQLYCSLPNRSGLSYGTIRPAKDASDPQHANVIASSGSIAIGKNWEVQYDNESIISTTGTETCGPAQNYYDFKAGGLYYKKTSGSTVRVTTEQSTLN